MHLSASAAGPAPTTTSTIQNASAVVRAAVEHAREHHDQMHRARRDMGTE
ncbi:hypothetical protein [Nocardia sp. CA-120079]